jgi:uncharacterized membrane protein
VDDTGTLVWAWIHVAGWAVYLGGALVMELVWRPAQRHLPQSQIAVACQWMGRRYRWVALSALLVAGVSGAALVVSDDRAVELSSSHGRTVLALGACWVVLVGTVAVIAVVAHPALHVRMSTELSDDERQAAREQVRRAIGRMDAILRFDLALALIAALLGASLESGGLW